MNRAIIQATLAELHEPTAFDGGNIEGRQGFPDGVLHSFAKLEHGLAWCNPLFSRERLDS